MVEMRLGEVNEVPGIIQVPRRGVSQENTRTVRWVQGTTEFTVEAYGFKDLESVLSIVATLR